MKGVARASVLALALEGCGTEWWQLLPLDASVEGNEEGGVGGEAGPDTASDDAPVLACTTDFDCSQTRQYCDPMHVCVDCLTDGHCKTPGILHCDSRHQCVECLQEPVDTCGPGRRCDVTQCFYACVTDSDCPAFARYCNTSQSRFVCVSCQNNDDCADAAVPSRCDYTKGRCEQTDSVVRPPPADAGALDAGDAAIDAQTQDATDADADAGD